MAHPVVAPLAEKVLRAVLVLAAALALLAGCDAAVGTPTDQAGPDGAEAKGSGAEGNAGGADPGEDPEPPNIVVIPTDDLAAGDLTPAMLEQMPNLRSLMEQGTTFENAFVTNSVCCPSRATILRGQYAHNHQVLSNGPPLGGAERFRILGGDNSTAATWLQEEGYRTAFFGKYLNAYYGDDYVPPGWDEWYAVSGNFLSNDLNENGHTIRYDPDRNHLDDVISEKVSDYVERTAGADPPFFISDRPFFMWIGTKAPHQPATPAPPPRGRTGRRRAATPSLLRRERCLGQADVDQG